MDTSVRIDNDEYEIYDEVIRIIVKNAEPNGEIHVEKTDRKEKVLGVVDYKFNEDQKLIARIENRASGKEKSKRLLNYDGKKLISKEIHKNGKLKYKTKSTFDDHYKTSFTKYNGKEAILYKRLTTYTDKEYKVISHKNDSVPFFMRKKTKGTITYQKGGVKQANRWEYEYNEEGERTKSTFYDKNNDVKHVWDYTCKTEGELVKVKNETQQCKWEEIENGMLVKVSRTTSPKGRITKTIQKYDTDTNIVEQTSYWDDIIFSKTTYNKSFYQPLTWESYYKGRLRFKHKYTYDIKGRKIGYSSYSGKNKAIAKRETKYIYKNDKLTMINYFRKGEPLSSAKITYN